MCGRSVMLAHWCAYLSCVPTGGVAITLVPRLASFGLCVSLSRDLLWSDFRLFTVGARGWGRCHRTMMQGALFRRW